MHGFIQKVLQSVRDRGLIPPGGRVLAAVSGGPDSVAMARALRVLPARLELAHVDHGNRPIAAERGLVEALARRLGCPFHALRCAPRSVSEADLRDARYGALLALGADRVATGHTASDQAETVLMRLLRGAGTAGLAGIPVRRGSIVRPLLQVTREEVLAFLREVGQPWCEDPTNADRDLLRNRVRIELLPRLVADFQPRIAERLVTLAETLRHDRDFLESAAGAAVTSSGMRLVALQALHVGLLPHVLRAACPVSLTAERLAAIVRLVHGQGGAVQVEGGVVAERSAGRLVFRRTSDCATGGCGDGAPDLC